MQAGRALVPFTHVAAPIVAPPLAAPPIAAPPIVVLRTAAAPIAEPMCAVAWVPLPSAPPPTVQPQPPTTTGRADITQIRPAIELALRRFRHPRRFSHERPRRESAGPASRPRESTASVLSRKDRVIAPSLACRQPPRICIVHGT